MSGPDVIDTEAPNPPWRHRDERRRHFFQRLSDRTPLRTKLITAVLVLVIIALSVISFASVNVLSSYLTTQHDTQLRSVSQRIVADPTGAFANLSANIAYPVAGNADVFAGVQQPGNQLSPMSSGPRLGGGATFGNSQPSVPDVPTSQAWATANSGKLVTVNAQSGSDSWRVIAAPITIGTVSGTLVVAYDLGDISAEIHRLITVDLIVSAAIIVVLAIVAIAVVRANLRPLNDIELTAGQIASGHLDHRVPEGDPRTEIGSLGQSLNAMLSQIERAFHSQEESEQAAHDSEERMRRFIADASHELRTPLTTIRGFAAHYRMRGGAGGSRRTGNGGRDGRSEDQEQPFRTDAFVPQSANGASHGGLTPEGPSLGDAPRDDLAPAGMPPEELDHLIGRVEAEATRMGLLVEDLLTLARLDQQRPLNLAPVDVLTLAADAVQDARIVSPGRPIDLIVAPGTAFLVEGDEQRLRQVLGNLVNNALTHTPAGTPVRVKIGAGTLPPMAAGRPVGSAAGNADGFASGAEGTATAGREPVPAVVLDVEDDGPGMPPEQAQRVFERFYRADAARNRASGGTGLGLAIVAGLVSAHGGTVSVRTAPGEGADFQVRLPLSPDALVSDDPDDTLPDSELAGASSRPVSHSATTFSCGPTPSYQF
jgi:two-component system, OmpR family, sensor kinase